MDQKRKARIQFSMVEYLCRLRKKLRRRAFVSLTGRCSSCLDFLNVPVYHISEDNDYEPRFHSLAINVANLVPSAARAQCRVCSILSASAMPAVRRHDNVELSSLYLLFQEKLNGGYITLVHRPRSYEDSEEPAILVCAEVGTCCRDRGLSYGDGREVQTLEQMILFRRNNLLDNSLRSELSLGHNQWDWRYVPQRRHIDKEILSRESVNLVRRWLAKCDVAHRLCKSDPNLLESLIPDHLLDIGTPSSPKSRLISTHQSPKVNYIALSYCWGATNTAATMASNYDQRLLEISTSSLPRTYKDAILFAHALGIRHLWIDAMCIIQDDIIDFDNQIAKMGKIYQQAYLVIAADRAANTNAGFLQSRAMYEPLRAFPSSVRHPDVPDLILMSHQTGDNNIHELFDTRSSASVSVLASHPVFQRGWCFQERILCTRILHFTARELIWECRSHIDCDCGLLDYEAGRGFPTLRGNFGKLYSDEAEGASQPSLLVLLNNWHTQVKWFSDCQLSFAQDRLLAISGIARDFKSPDSGRYFAGIWESELPQGLMWRSSYHEAAPTNDVSSEVYVAPSWSWASVKGQIEWSSDYEGDKVILSFAEVFSVHCQPLSGDEYGRLQHGMLILRGPLLKPLPEMPKDRGYYYIPPPSINKARINCSLAIVSGEWENTSIDATIQLDSCEAGGGPAFESLLLAFLDIQAVLVHGGHEYMWRALAVVKDPENQSEYRRVGVAEAFCRLDFLRHGYKLSDWDGTKTLPLSLEGVNVLSENVGKKSLPDIGPENGLNELAHNCPRCACSLFAPDLESSIRTTVGRKPFHSHIVDPEPALSELKFFGAALRTITIV